LAETHSREFETNTCTQHTTFQFDVFVLYLVKTNNDFYGMQYSIKYTRYCISLHQACVHRIALTWFQLNI